MHQSDLLFERSLALYESHAPIVLTYLLRQLPSREEAEDLLLEVFMVVLEKESMLPLDERIQRAWILTVARYKVADFYRRAGRLTRVPMADVEERIYDPEEYEPEQAFLRQEAYAQLQIHVQKLAKLPQEVLWLRFVEGLRCGEIARVIGRSERSTRMLLYRTLKRLRGMYDQERAERGL